MVDRSLLESDVENGALGDFLTDKILYPYQPISNEPYLSDIELAAKRRVVHEEVKDLVVQYGELARGLVAKPEFFGLSRLRRRARGFFPSLNDYIRLLNPEVRDRNLLSLRESFRRAISKLPADILEADGEYFTISDSAVDRWIKARTSKQVVNILKQSQRSVYSYLTKGRTMFLNLELMSRELLAPVGASDLADVSTNQPEDPKNHLFIHTERGLVSLNEESSLEEIISKLRPARPITVSPLAGMLNEVFLVTLGSEKYVAKKFTDWHGFKWFTLNLVAFGSKLFAVSGKTRMSNEYGINRFLAKKGILVPKVVHVNLPQRILIEDYVSGVPLNKLVSKAVNNQSLSGSEQTFAETLGQTLAAIHRAGVSVGDSKPENFVAHEDSVYSVDLEQAGRPGDHAWDVAELLYYSGHYCSSPTPTKGLKQFVQDFIHGYSRDGHSTVLRKAAGVRYAKPFSIWTPAPVIYEVSKQLKDAS